MTFNDFYIANNLSPEDNFSAQVNPPPLNPWILLKPGIYINSHGLKFGNGITYA